MAPHHPDSSPLSWSALLAHWTTFAQASLALPKTAEGDRWRSAVPPIINLQAVTLALKDLDRLDTAPAADNANTDDDASADEGTRALALDKAEIIIRSSTGQLHALWRGDLLPEELVTLSHDAIEALKAAQSTGLEWRVVADELYAEHPGDLVDRLMELNFEGDLLVPTPGIPLFRSSPAAFARNPDGSRPSDHIVRAIKEFLIGVGKPETVSGPRQVYRQFDFASGKVTRDLVVTIEPAGGTGGNASSAQRLPAGQPLLVPAIDGGRILPVTLPARKGPPIDSVPVVFESSHAD